MLKIAVISAGGVLGVLSRYALSGFTQRQFSGIFPYGTMAVNLLGCFLAGVLWAAADRMIVPSLYKPLVFAGFLGGFTTFSAFAVESMNLFKDGEIKLALVNILANNLGGLILVFAGFVIAEYLLK